MSPAQERPELAPIPPERIEAVAAWIQANVRPVAQVISEGAELEGQLRAAEFDRRDYQLEAFVRLDDRRAEGGTRALGNLATGLGKTFVAAVDVMRYREWCAEQSPSMIPRVLYVSHQNDINVQAEKTFHSVMPDADYTTFNPRRRQLPDADVTFATIQALYQNLHRFDPQDFEYIIWDESHHLEAETFKAVRDYFEPLFEHAVTATVERMDGKDIQEYFGEPLYKKSLPEGIAEGWLKDVDYHIVFDAAIRDKLKGGFNPKTLQEIKDLFKDKPPRDAIARNIKEEIERLGLVDPKTIVFCEDIGEANEMAVLLNGVAYHSETKDRQQKLDDFRAGRNRTMTTRDMFNEGVDIPDAEVIVFLRSTGSSTIFDQQLGRGLRKFAGKPKVYVLDFVANIERIAKVRELSEAIQRRAREIGQQDVTEEGIIFDGQESEIEANIGMHVHTAHSNFDFDKMAVDLLEKFADQSVISLPLPPEGYVSIRGAAEELGVSHELVTRVTGELAWELPTFRFGSVRGSGISLEQLDLLKSHPSIKASSEFIGISEAGQRYGISYSAMRGMLNAKGWELPRHKLGGGKRAQALTGAQLEELRISYPDNFLEPLPDGIKSLGTVASELGVDHRALKRAVKDIGWELPRYKYSGQPVDGINSEQIEILRRHESLVVKEADNITSVTGLAAEVGYSYEKMSELLTELGVVPERYRFGTKLGYGLDSKQVEKVKANLDQEIPEGWLTFEEAALELGLGRSGVIAAVRKQGWDLPKYKSRKGKGPRTQALSPGHMQALRERRK